MDDKWEIDSDSSLLPILEKSEGMAIDVIRNGEVIAQVIPSSRHDRTAADAAMSRLLALKLDLGLKPGETVKDLINEGRKY